MNIKRPKKTKKKSKFRCKNCYGFFDNPLKYDNGEIGCYYCGHDDITKNEEYRKGE